MKLKNLFILSLLVVPLIANPLKAEIVIETVSGIRVETNSETGVNISIPNQKINSSNETIIKKNDDYSTPQNSSSSGGTCYQGNTQSNKVEGSSRTTVQSSTINCD